MDSMKASVFNKGVQNCASPCGFGGKARMGGFNVDQINSPHQEDPKLQSRWRKEADGFGSLPKRKMMP